MTDALYKLISPLGLSFRIDAIPKLPPERQQEEWVLLYKEGCASYTVIDNLPEPQRTEAILLEFNKASTPEYVRWSGGYNSAIDWARMLPEPQKVAHLSTLINRLVEDQSFSYAINAMRCLQPSEQEQFMIRIVNIHIDWIKKGPDKKGLLERIGKLLEQYYAG